VGVCVGLLLLAGAAVAGVAGDRFGDRIAHLRVPEHITQSVREIVGSYIPSASRQVRAEAIQPEGFGTSMPAPTATGTLVAKTLNGRAPEEAAILLVAGSTLPTAASIPIFEHSRGLGALIGVSFRPGAVPAKRCAARDLTASCLDCHRLTSPRLRIRLVSATGSVRKLPREVVFGPCSPDSHV
jgi:hypothetical protein